PAGASARSTLPPPAGRRRSATGTRRSGISPTRAASPWCWGATPPARPTASGRPSTSRRRSSCRCSSTSRTTASGSPCPRICRPRAATLPRTCDRSQASRSSRATAPIPERPPPDPGSLTQHVFFENPDGTRALQEQGGLAPEGHVAAPASRTARPSGPRINMLTAIRRTLDVELALNPRMLVFGEDVGPKGGVHGATLGLQDKYGAPRVFDTSLSEEGIVGRAVGMALAGLLPVAEIQF